MAKNNDYKYNFFHNLDKNHISSYWTESFFVKNWHSDFKVTERTIRLLKKWVEQENKRKDKSDQNDLDDSDFEEVV